MMSPEDFACELNVSRETLVRLIQYEATLKKWNPAINLVSSSTLDDLWGRHFFDSAQLARFLPESGHWADFGSGGGFPGMVLAIMAAESAPGVAFTLVESDVRKAAFLQAVAREVGVAVQIRSQRIEKVERLDANVISARALAPLAQLLELAFPHLAKNGQAIFLKGAGGEQELTEALASWRFSVQKYPSQSDPRGVILNIGGLSRA